MGDYIEVDIGGVSYKVSAAEDKEYVQKVAEYVNNKLEAVKTIEGYAQMGRDNQTLLMYLNLADDYFKLEAETRQQVTENSQAAEDELYKLKCELVELRLQLEKMEAEAEEQKVMFEIAMHRADGEVSRRKDELERLRQELDTYKTKAEGA